MTHRRCAVAVEAAWNNRRRAAEGAAEQRDAAGQRAAVATGRGLIERMARRDDGDLVVLLEQLAGAPWWVSVVLAVVVYIGLSKLLPSAVGDGSVFGPMVDVVSTATGCSR